MLGPKALRTCSVCRDKLRTARIPVQVPGPSSRGISTTPPSRNLDTKSISNDIDDSVFASHPLTNPDTSHGLRKTLIGLEVEGPEGEGEEVEWTPREERRSPAAVFGSKRIGLEVVPRRMEENIQSEINSMSPSCQCTESFDVYPHEAKDEGADDRPPPPRNPRSFPIFVNCINKTTIETRTI